MTLVYIVVAILVLTLLWLIGVYNSLVTLNTRTDEAWSDIQVQLKRRCDLIPNLVRTVKAYAKHERKIFEEVARARLAALEAKNPAEKEKAENMLTQALRSVFAVAENYPQLRASENFLRLQEELTDTENKIEAARRFYNANVRDFNIKIKIFPNNLFARWLGFKKRELFKLQPPQSATAKEPPKVNFEEK